MSVSTNTGVISTQTQSPETYLGTDRRANMLRSNAPLSANEWSLGGQWSVQAESITSTRASTLRYNFSARDVYLVLGGSGTISVRVDGKTDNL